MPDWRAVFAKEAFNRIQRAVAQFFLKAQPEGLRGRGIQTIKDDLRASTFHPFDAALGLQAAVRHRKLQTGVAFSALQPLR